MRAQPVQGAMAFASRITELLVVLFWALDVGDAARSCPTALYPPQPP